MSETNTNQPPASIDDTCIPLEEGMTRTNNWREIIKPIFNYDESILPRAVYIPIADITALAEKHKVEGVRMYFSIKSIAPPYFDAVCGLLVPVGLDGKDIITDLGTAGASDDVSSIYDFTRPCPTECDKTSPLY